MGRNRCTGTGAGVAQAFARSSGQVEMDPLLIHYTHSRIRPFFSGCGRRVMDTLADLVEGRMELDDLPRIQVIIADGGHVFSLNNRRLFVLKCLREKGLLPNNMITVRTRPGKAHELERYTPERCSLKGKIMREFKKDGKGGNKDSGSDNDDDDDVRDKDEAEGEEKQTSEASAVDAEIIEVQVAGAKVDDAALSGEKIVGVPTDQLDDSIVEAHSKRVEELLDGVELDDDL